MMQRKAVSAVFFALPWSALALVAGCMDSAASRALFTRPELYTYERHAVLGLEPEQEQIFMAAYLRAFPSRLITFVERSRLREVVNEQDLLRGRLNERSRARIKQILGVEALIMCEYYGDGEAGHRSKKLRVRIVDSETGAITGSVVIGASSNFAHQAREAAEALKYDLLHGGHRRFDDQYDYDADELPGDSTRNR